MQILHRLYPVDALPEDLRQAIYEVDFNIQSPQAMIAASALSAISIACQGQVDVRMPTGGVIPTSLAFVTIAESGERKTATDQVFMRPLLEFQQKLTDSDAEARTAHKAALAIWQMEHQALESKLKKALKKGDETDGLKLKYAQSLQAQPVLQQVPQLLYGDTTIEALLFNLHKVWPYAALLSSEGSSILNGRAMQQLGPLNELWDGVESLRVDRKTEESFTIKCARMVISLMVQRKPFEQFLQRNDAAAWETGFLSRALVCEPTSRQGSRRIQVRSDDGRTGLYLEKFAKRVTELLEQTLEAQLNGRARTILVFNPEARTEWCRYANWIEQKLWSGGQYAGIKGFASKLANNTARLAALLHYFCGKNGDIDIDSVKAAISICDWYANEFCRIFAQQDPAALDQEYGYILDQWLADQYYRTGRFDYRVSDLYRLAPNKLRKREAMRTAIDNLVSLGKVQDFRFGKPSFIRLNLTPMPLI